MTTLDLVTLNINLIYGDSFEFKLFNENSYRYELIVNTDIEGIRSYGKYHGLVFGNPSLFPNAIKDYPFLEEDL